MVALNISLFYLTGAVTRGGYCYSVISLAILATTESLIKMQTIERMRALGERAASQVGRSRTLFLLFVHLVSGRGFFSSRLGEFHRLGGSPQF